MLKVDAIFPKGFLTQEEETSQAKSECYVKTDLNRVDFYDFSKKRIFFTLSLNAFTVELQKQYFLTLTSRSIELTKKNSDISDPIVLVKTE
jgi:hypothetical protein